MRAGDYEHAGDILEWIPQQLDDVLEDKFESIAMQRGWAGQARDRMRFARYLFTVLSNWADASIGEKRATQRRTERLETTARTRIHEEITGDPSSEKRIRRESRDTDAGGTGEKVRRALRQKIRQ